jgi:hypothetical protein
MIVGVKGKYGVGIFMDEHPNGNMEDEIWMSCWDALMEPGWRDDFRHL